jgi:hypothetical protein
MYRQTDDTWKNVLMTSPLDLPGIPEKEKNTRWEIHKDGVQGDKLGRWGCFVTALCNAYNNKLHKDITPEMLNAMIRNEKGYNVLLQGKECPISRESYVVEKVVCKILNLVAINDIGNNLEYLTNNIQNPQRAFIAKVPFMPPSIMSPHYNYIISYSDKIIKHYDSDSGAIRTDWANHDRYSLKEICF